MNLLMLAYDNNPSTNFQNVFFVVDFIATTILILLLTFFVSYNLKNKLVLVFYCLMDIIYIISMICGLDNLTLISLFFLVGGTILFLFVNAGIIRKYVAIPLKFSSNSKKGKEDFDREKLINNIVTAVRWMSQNKVGGLITFERSTPLDDYMKNGTIINCPVTPEIIETIFYVGTRLHDGAIVIRGDTIVAAAVYYTPSTKALPGKVGSRHRAALGISEVTDSVTIVVSEETGRVAIAHAGMLDPVKNDEVEKVFRNQFSAN
ncbi:MAG: DNA integrity scanning protein DisA nucleotide-binding domain protein [Bacilli bacterium]|jgi:diadenylate cyclase|nr:DNA integrity scanning protein DisA nucleotide-binding domain protein [Bacilli bacterium]